MSANGQTEIAAENTVTLAGMLLLAQWCANGSQYKHAIEPDTIRIHDTSGRKQSRER